mgnify:CR=1 FL=1
MAIIKLRTTAPDKARPLIHQALERERELVRDVATRTRQKVTQLASKTGADLHALEAGLVPHPEDQDMELLELEGEVELLKRLEEELRILETIEICP